MAYRDFILKRHPQNPIITPDALPMTQALFNPGQTVYQGKALLLVSRQARSGYVRGRTAGTTHVATSEDGLHFTIDPTPLLDGIDCRVTRIGETYYIVNPAVNYDMWGTYAQLGRTRDFKSYERVETISLPDNRVPCLFPEKIQGHYMRIDRPYRVCPNNFHDMGNLWLSSSPDLIHWGRHRPLLKKGFAGWTGEKIGPTPPIKTDKGWLVIIHGVSESAGGHRYALGAILLNLENPCDIVGKTYSYILAPEEPYETCGRVPNVVFTCGAIADEERDMIHVYYGAADTCIGLATGSLQELLDACIREL